jgi:hypothetical protein
MAGQMNSYLQDCLTLLETEECGSDIIKMINKEKQRKQWRVKKKTATIE